MYSVYRKFYDGEEVKYWKQISGVKEQINQK
jgi:hypothetical protein